MAIVRAEPVVALGAESLSLERLARAVQDGPVTAGTLTDEELLLMAGTVGDPEPHYDAPRLSLLSAEQRALALDVALRLLRARGLAREDEDGRVDLTGLAGVIGEVRAAAELTLRVRVDVHGQQLRRTVLYRARADLFLTEGVSTGGLHAFSFRGLDAQAAWLATAVAPDLRGGRTEPARTYAAAEDLEVSSEELAAASDVAALVFAPCAGDPPTRSFHSYSDAAGVQVLQGRQSASDTITLQRLSAQGLVAFCADFLARTTA